MSEKKESPHLAWSDRRSLEDGYPHAGGCPGCYNALRCNVCGADIALDRGRCTNGRCAGCHAAVCTSGGRTSPGHGFGQLAIAARRVRLAAK